MGSGRGNGQAQGGGQGLYVSLKDGDKVQGVFRGDPVILHTHWFEGKSIKCPGKDECPHCAGGAKPRFRFKLNFYTKQNGDWSAKIFEGGWSILKELKKLQDAGYKLEDTVIQVARKGAEMDTEYAVTPLPPNGQVSAKELAVISKIPPHELKDKPAPTEDSQSGDFNSSDVPF